MTCTIQNTKFNGYRSVRSAHAYTQPSLRHIRRKAGRAANHVVAASSGSPVVTAIVSALTSLLQLTGARTRLQASSPSPQETCTAPGDVPGMLEALRSEYASSYFVTGTINAALYAPNCKFGDPTVSFSGRERYISNIKLLVPFLDQPELVLKDLQQASLDGTQPVVLQASWTLRTAVKLPWRPYVLLQGQTAYTLSRPDSNYIVQHVESWDLTPWEALLTLLRPGRPRT